METTKKTRFTNFFVLVKRGVSLTVLQFFGLGKQRSGRKKEIFFFFFLFSFSFSLLFTSNEC